MAIDNLQNGDDHNPLSGAYIRNFVKQLTKPNLNTTQKNLILSDNDTLLVPNYHNYKPMTSTSTTTKKQAMARPNLQHDRAQGHKKQVRRRLHTSRPYQERLLNMAEARKEIVTALKYHRASMKQANDRKQTQQNDHHQQVQSGCQKQVLGRDYYENSRKVESEQLSVDSYGNYYPTDFDNNNQNYSSSSNTSTSPSNEPAPILYESLNNIPLPNQTLGLNLNLQAFTNLDTKLCHSINTTTSTTTNSNNYPSSMRTSPSSSSSPLSSNSSGIVVATTGAEGVGPTRGNNMISGMDMHPTLDQEEIAKVRSIGEQYQIEWDDTLNLVKSARWFKFLKTVDIGKEMKESYYNTNSNDDYDNNLPFGELMEIPPWLSPINDESFLQQQHLDDSCSDDTTLPWMDIGDIDAMDDEWLS